MMSGQLSHRRDIALLNRDLEEYRKLQPHLFPELENTPDLRRGDMRLAAEIALTSFHGILVPKDQRQAFLAARLKALDTLNVLAKG